MTEIRNIGIPPEHPDWENTWTYKIDYLSSRYSSVYSSRISDEYTDHEAERLEDCEFPVFCRKPRMTLVSSIHRDQGLGVDAQSTGFHYHDFRRDNYWGFLGFGQIESTDSHNDRNRISLYDNFTYDENIARYPFLGLITSTREIYTIAEDTTHLRFLVNDLQFQINPARYFPYIRNVISYDYYSPSAYSSGEIVRIRSTNTTFEFDAYGSIGERKTQVFGQNSELVMESLKNTLYHDYVSDWRIGLPYLVTTRNSLYESDGSLRDRMLRTEEISYKTDSELVESSIREPEDTLLEKTTRQDYDKYGNIVETSVHAFGSPYPCRSLDSDCNKANYNYDSEESIYQVVETNSLGHQTYRVFHNAFDIPYIEQDPNGLNTIVQTDGFGRTVMVSTPDEAITTIELGTEIVGDDRARMSINTAITDGQDVTSVYNRAGKKIAERTTGFDGNLIIKNFTHNEKGLLEREDFLNGMDTYFKQYEYDALGRLLETRISDGKGTVLENIYDEMGGTAETRCNAKRACTTHVRNALGQVNAVVDTMGNKTEYEYNPFGKIKTIIDPSGNTIEIVHDIWGRKTTIHDPDTGVIEETYNGLDRPVSTWTPRSRTTRVFDQLGRILTNENTMDGTSEYSYDTQMLGRIDWKLSADGHKEVFVYDEDTGQIEQKQLIINVGTPDEMVLASNLRYSRGKLEEVTYPSAGFGHSFTIRYDYNHGVLSQASRVEDGLVFWRLHETDDLGRPTRVSYGNDVVRDIDYYKNGNIEQLRDSYLSSSIQNMSYTYDDNWNVDRRTDWIGNCAETFVYDSLDRVGRSDVTGDCVDASGYTGETSMDYRYSNIGNLIYKSDIGRLYYHDVRPHAVSNTSDKVFSYDSSGNQNLRNADIYTYNAFNKIKHIELETGEFTELQYTADGNRTVKTEDGRRKIYFEGMYEFEEYDDGTKEHRYFVNIDSNPIAVANVKWESRFEWVWRHFGSYFGWVWSFIGPYFRWVIDSEEDINYLHKDHLGSVTAITDSDANIVETIYYDAFGQARNDSWLGPPSSVENGLGISIGYTGFEHDERETGDALINANGREYDPAIGRFLSPDPVIEQPYNIQSLNRYSYVMNNPLNRIDPTGFTSLAFIVNTSMDVMEETSSEVWDAYIFTDPARGGETDLPFRDVAVPVIVNGILDQGDLRDSPSGLYRVQALPEHVSRELESLYRRPTVGNPTEMVDSLIAFCEKYRIQISHLQMHVHGSPGVMHFGDGDINLRDLGRLAPTLRKLRPYLADGAQGLLSSCSIAEGRSGRRFVSEFSRILNIPIHAADVTTYHQDSSIRFNGTYSFGNSRIRDTRRGSWYVFQPDGAMQRFRGRVSPDLPIFGGQSHRSITLEALGIPRDNPALERVVNDTNTTIQFPGGDIMYRVQ
ncbi:MAG: DUF4347 domain-containing protein [Deltaproteobacteria bacterium]|nr:DUF4347 domain-containing protein [Deltaproteobacteria bacterium]